MEQINDSDEQTILLQKNTTRLNANPKYSYLDGLRGILCLIVVLSHTLLMGNAQTNRQTSIFFQPWLHNGPLRILIAGEFAVASFFVLSAFVLTRRFLENSADSTILISGLMRRFPRLFVPSTIALLFYFGILHFRSWPGSLICHEVGEGSFDAEQIGIGYVLLNSFGQYFWMPSLYTIQWTMQVEFVGSVIVYGLVFLFTRSKIRRFRWLLYAFLLLILPIVWLVTDQHVPRAVQYIVPFTMGLLLSDFDANQMLNLFKTLRLRWSIFINCLLLISIFYFGSFPVFNTTLIDGKTTIWSPFNWMFGWFWISFAGFVLLFFSLRSKSFQRFLSTKPIEFLGKISFGIYLLHYLMICLVDSFFIRTTERFFHRDIALVIGFVFLILPLTGFLAFLFFLYVDAPAVTLSHWFYFLIFRCSSPTQRPPQIQRRIFVVFLSLSLILLIISGIPGEKGYRHCAS